METFHRKGDRGELERATASFNDMLGHVDRLGDMLAQARGKLHSGPTLVAETAS